MQNSNQSDRSPNPKLARYLTRIQQLVGNRGRTPSPITSRMSRPLKPKSLDHYLKYQLTLKIIYRFFDRNNQACMRHFFNSLRNREMNSKIQKIYKFVPIEKTECAHMIVDTGISTKMLTNILKTKLKQVIKWSFDQIRSQSLAESKIMVQNTARSAKSNFMPLSISDKKIGQLSIILVRLELNRKSSCFNKIKLFNLIQQQQRDREIVEYMKRRIRIYNISSLQYLYKTFKQINTGKIRSGFNALLVNSMRVNLKIHQRQIYIFKFIMFTKFVYFKNKKLCLGSIRQFKNSYNFVLKLKRQQQQKETLTKDNQLEQSLKLIQNQKNKLNQSVIRQASNWIGMRLISILYRRKLDSIRQIERFSWKKIKSLNQIYSFLNKKFLIKCSIGLSYLKRNLIQSKTLQEKKKSNDKGFRWKQINNLVNFSKYFSVYLKQPFKRIKQYSENREYYQQNTKLIAFFVFKSKVYQYFQAIKQFSEAKKQKDLKLYNEYLQEARLQKKQFLPKIILKVVIFRQIDAFIKLKNTKKRSNIFKINRNRSRTQWFVDIQNFISQRNKFNKSLLQNYGKIQEIINNGKKFVSEITGQSPQKNGFNQNSFSKNSSQIKLKNNINPLHIK